MGKPVAKLLGMEPEKPPDPRIAQAKAERNAARAEEAQRKKTLGRTGRASTILTGAASSAATGDKDTLG